MKTNLRLRFAALLLALALVTTGISGSGAPTGIAWNARCSLAWSDFQAEPPAGATAEAALIAMRINWHVAYTVAYDPARQLWTGTIDPSGVTVTNTMDPNSSWVRPGAASPMLLDHEQRHFDLNEVYARTLASALAALSVTETTRDAADAQLRQAIATTSSRILNALKVMQRGYDDQTGHGTRREQQHRWDEQIAAWLRDSDAAPATVRDAHAFLSSKMAIGGQG